MSAKYFIVILILFHLGLLETNAQNNFDTDKIKLSELQEQKENNNNTNEILMGAEELTKDVDTLCNIAIGVSIITSVAACYGGYKKTTTGSILIFGVSSLVKAYFKKDYYDIKKMQADLKNKQKFINELIKQKKNYSNP